MIQPEAYDSQGVEGDVLNKNSLCRLIMFEYFILSCGNFFGRIRKCDIIGGVLVLGVVLEVLIELGHFHHIACLLI